MKIEISESKFLSLAVELSENEVERRIGEWLAIEVDETDTERYTDEAQDLFNEVYDENVKILGRHFTHTTLK